VVVITVVVYAQAKTRRWDCSGMRTSGLVSTPHGAMQFGGLPIATRVFNSDATDQQSMPAGDGYARRLQLPVDRPADEYDAIWEAMNRHLANICVVHTEYSSTNRGKSFNQLQCPTRFSDEMLSDTWVAIAIPSRRFLVLDFCKLDDLKRFQRPSTSRSTRSSTARQSVLASWPAQQQQPVFQSHAPKLFQRPVPLLPSSQVARLPTLHGRQAAVLRLRREVRVFPAPGVNPSMNAEPRHVQSHRSDTCARSP
jgi:hypothetical protein